jgi:transcriptional regulator with XRE-family HTH domain
VNEREQAAFGAALRRERERRNLSLDTIAEQTKVSTGLLGGLERGDLARWPAGIFRRAFVRSYAEAVGLDATEVLREFVRLFPDAEAESHDATLSHARTAPPSRARLLGASFSTWRRLGAATSDLVFTALAAAAGYFTLGLDIGLAGAVLVQALAVALGGGSLGMLLVQPRARGTASAGSEELRIQEAGPVESRRPGAPAPPAPARAARQKRGHRSDRRDARGGGDGWSPHH